MKKSRDLLGESPIQRNVKVRRRSVVYYIFSTGKLWACFSGSFFMELLQNLAQAINVASITERCCRECKQTIHYWKPNMTLGVVMWKDSFSENGLHGNTKPWKINKTNKFCSSKPIRFLKFMWNLAWLWRDQSFVMASCSEGTFDMKIAKPLKKILLRIPIFFNSLESIKIT